MFSRFLTKWKSDPRKAMKHGIRLYCIVERPEQFLMVPIFPAFIRYSRRPRCKQSQLSQLCAGRKLLTEYSHKTVPSSILLNPFPATTMTRSQKQRTTSLLKVVNSLGPQISKEQFNTVCNLQIPCFLGEYPGV